MKAISLYQPWATLMSLGQKNFETRHWSTTHRGLLAIHATKTFPEEAKMFCFSQPCRSVLQGAGLIVADLPFGCIVAVVEMLGYATTGYIRFDKTNFGVRPAQHEKDFGDYSPGRFAWITRGVQRLPQPVPCRGMQGLWDVPADVVAAIRAQGIQL